jgi:spermidine/putrescine transport system ATP-binding protein
MTATVDIEQVSHQYGDFQALADINLTIEAGSFAVLLGPSGCGKTTLLSVLGGFLRPTRGAVLLDGVEVTDVPPAKRATTTMFQDYALFPHMSLTDNVGFGLRMRGHSKKERRARAQELLEMVGLDASASKKPHELSGGQRQRVALARALAVEPDVLLLDEPLGALDLKLRRQMQGELKAIQKRVGTTFIHVTHDQEEAMAVADQIIVMNAGRVEDSGTPESIYLRPQTAFSAAFMGEANMIKGQVESVAASGVVVSCVYGLLNVGKVDGVEPAIAVGDSVQLCFRPEHFQPVLSEPEVLPISSARLQNLPDTTLNLGPAKVIDHAFFGAYQRCEVVVKRGATFTLHLPQNYRINVGEELPLSIDAASIILLRNE